MGARLSRRLLPLTWSLALALSVGAAFAQPGPAAGASATAPARGPASADPERSSVGATPQLGPNPDLSNLIGRRLTRIEIVNLGGRWQEKTRLTRTRIGDTLTPELARRALRELTDSGRFASVRAEAQAEGAGAVLRLFVLPRRLIASIRLTGTSLDAEETLRAAGIREGGEITAPELPRLSMRIRAFYTRRGYPAASVETTTIDTDDPMRVVLEIEVRAGSPLKVERRLFGVWPDPKVAGLEPVLASYAIDEGDVLDEESLAAADRELEQLMHGRGWHRASVDHRVDRRRGLATTIHVLVRAGPLLRVSFEGARHFDAAQLEDALEIASSEDRAPATLLERLRNFYVARGFLDVEISVKELGGADSPIHELLFEIRENPPVRIVAREYPCLWGKRAASDVGAEIDGFLSEELPGADILSSVDPALVDKSIGPQATTGTRVPPYELNPWKTYVPDVYESAMKHVQDLYRSEGYLSATVGPAQLLRRRCHPRSPAGQCVPVGPRLRPPTTCRYDEIGLPLEEPAPAAALACTPDPARGIRCEPEAVLHIPVKLGPRTMLYDVAFEGNRILVESDLEEAAELELGEPLSQAELEKARRRLLDAYAEEGFAFAEVETELDVSPDRTRGRARFIISEREQVRVSAIVVRGAIRTSESLIRSRIALEVGGLYRRSLVRRTEELLATLGVFSTVTIGFEDPYIPAREKVIVVTVVERRPQYLDVRPGFSTGEGFRITFEYGHRNLAGEAIQLTLRSQLGYLPTPFIFEEDVRLKYEELDVGERLERRNTATVEFPEIGLGPLFRLSVEGVDVRDNARDFGLTKDAAIVTLTFRPERRFSVQLGGSLERNDATIFETGAGEKLSVDNYVRDNPDQAALFRVPEGTTVAVAERIGFTWDRRDNPFGATQGTLFAAGVEHVRADPVGRECNNDPQAGPFEPTCSQFLRWTNRIAGYVRLSEKGLALALSYRWGYNQQLIAGSRTYPDRLFFLGGVDSIRGYLQDSLIPQDIAEELLKPESELTLSQVLVRGGDVFVNPRAELRIPLSTNVQTALFVDAGNLWTEPSELRPFDLRYAAGTGIRIATPIGPLVFDYGFNIDRVLDEFYPDRSDQRFWEELGAFHFSIGLF
jgi:outer membrane protein assembly factor BamA